MPVRPSRSSGRWRRMRSSERIARDGQPVAWYGIVLVASAPVYGVIVLTMLNGEHEDALKRNGLPLAVATARHVDAQFLDVRRHALEELRHVVEVDADAVVARTQDDPALGDEVTEVVRTGDRRDLDRHTGDVAADASRQVAPHPAASASDRPGRSWPGHVPTLELDEQVPADALASGHCGTAAALPRKPCGSDMLTSLMSSCPSARVIVKSCVRVRARLVGREIDRGGRREGLRVRSVDVEQRVECCVGRAGVRGHRAGGSHLAGGADSSDRVEQQRVGRTGQLDAELLERDVRQVGELGRDLTGRLVDPGDAADRDQRAGRRAGSPACSGPSRPGCVPGVSR